MQPYGEAAVGAPESVQHELLRVKALAVAGCTGAPSARKQSLSPEPGTVWIEDTHVPMPNPASLMIDPEILSG
jgi:hypothetical protein